MRPKGIHNPFEKPKKEFRTFFDDPPPDTESELRIPPTILLDGDSYALKFVDATFEDIQDRLYALLYDVNLEQKQGLQDHGIYINQPRTELLTLKTKGGTISVHTSSDDEVEVFRRIAYALKKLPVQKILKKHAVTIKERF